MTVFYAPGGGYGHLQRVRRFSKQQGIKDLVVISNNPSAAQLFDPKFVRVLPNEEFAGEFVAEVVREFDPEVFVVDTFPAGIFGELNKSSCQCTVNYLGRRLKWDTYRFILPEENLLRFDTAFLFEELEQGHENFIRQYAANVVPIQLEAEVEPPGDEPHMDEIWMVVHTFLKAEVESLVDDALDIAAKEGLSPTIFLFSDIKVNRNNVIHQSGSPIKWYSRATRIFCGGGFNTLLELRPYRKKVRAVPFPRKYDDQAWRIRSFFENVS